MKNIQKLLFAAIAMVSITFSAKAEPVVNHEYQDVVDTVFNYFNGLANADQDLLSKAFDREFGHIKMI
jgi:hypothetical protein